MKICRNAGLPDIAFISIIVELFSNLIALEQLCIITNSRQQYLPWLEGGSKSEHESTAEKLLVSFRNLQRGVGLGGDTEQLCQVGVRSRMFLTKKH